MKTIIFFLFVFIISFSTNYSQNGNKGVERKTENKADNEATKFIQHTIPIIDQEPRTRPQDPTKRDPINLSPNPIPPPSRPIIPLNSPIHQPEPPVVIYTPIPIFDDPPIVEPDYTYSIETTPIMEIDHNYEELGLSQYKEEEFYDALVSFQLALAKDTLNYSLYYYIGTTEIEIGRYDEAVNDLTTFIDNVIENRLGFYQRGLANFYLGNRDAALDDLLTADQYKVDGAKVILRRFYDYY